MSLIINFITSGSIEIGDFLYMDCRTKGKLRSMARLKYTPKYIFGRAIREIDKNLWAIQIKSEKN